ncbi:hypothetical protein BB561_000682 [Smittium simulii]|uniref:Ras-GEF domain-containing protein n=1 Tax=Smittium simulii TaxID=133385 RepID=A0A2T9YY35_9FUNG|nr:hypothetical protein BB561_000682 [Smittium simulii]
MLFFQEKARKSTNEYRSPYSFKLNIQTAELDHEEDSDNNLNTAVGPLCLLKKHSLIEIEASESQESQISSSESSLIEKSNTNTDTDTDTDVEFSPNNPSNIKIRVKKPNQNTSDVESDSDISDLADTDGLNDSLSSKNRSQIDEDKYNEDNLKEYQLETKKEVSNSNRDKFNQDSTKSVKESHNFPGGLKSKFSLPFLGKKNSTIKQRNNSDFGKVNGGIYDALIEYLTPPGKSNEDFDTAFMLTFRVFASSQVFTESLIKRFNLVAPPSLNASELKIWHEKKAKPVKIKVYNIFLDWFENYWYGPEDNECLSRILLFFNEIKDKSYIPSKESKKAAIKIEKTIEESRLYDKDHFLAPKDYGDRELLDVERRVNRVSKELHKRESIVDLSFDAYKHLSHIAQIDPEDVASQLTILQSECYCKIIPIELLRNEFSKKVGSKSPHVKLMIKWSNQISRWVAALILYEKTPEKRSRVIKYFLELALECLRLKNYSAVMDIQSALNSSAILRLKQTWSLLPKKCASIIKKLQISTDPGKNYLNYRNVLKKSTPPLLPFLGLYLTDLTFVCDGNPDIRRRKLVDDPQFFDSGDFLHTRDRENTLTLDSLNLPTNVDIRQKDILINFDKHYKVSQIIRQIQKYQIPYSGNFTMAIPGLQKYILNQIEYWDKENYDDDKLYILSLQREPRARMNIVMEKEQRYSLFTLPENIGSMKSRKST